MNGIRLLLDRMVAVLLAVAVHLFFGALLFFGLSVSQAKLTPPPQPTVIEATIVDLTALTRSRKEKDDASKRKEEKRRDAERKREQARKLEAAKEALAAKKQKELEKKLIEQRREQQRADQRRKVARELKKAQEKKQREKRLADEKRLNEEKIRREKLEQIDRLKKAREKAEQERKIEEQRLAQLEALRETEENLKQKQLDEQRRKQLLDRELAQNTQKARSTLEQNYYASIQELVKRNWLRPATIKRGLQCRIRINQIPGGEVTDAYVDGRCNADEAAKRTIIAAVKRASPLPYKGFETVFVRQFSFNFKH